MMTVVEFKQEHLKQLNPKACHIGEMPQLVMTYALTILDTGKPVAIFGGFLFIPGVIHFWGLVSEEVKQKPFSFHKTVKKMITYYEKNQKPRRVQIDVKADYEEGKRWAQALGFEYEGTMKRYGVNGEDFHLYARMNPWAQ